MSIRLRSWIAVWLLCWLPGSAATAAQYAVVLPGDSTLTRSFVSALSGALPDHTVITLAPSEPVPAGTDAVITMGRASLDARLQQSDTLPTLATYVTGESLHDHRTLKPNTHALLANPKPSRQTALARLLLPNARRMGLLLSASYQEQLQEWQQAAEQNTAQLVSVAVNEGDNLTRRLVEAITSSDVILGTDDSQIYNADNLKTILITSYSRNRVLIGPSAPFIDAGSLSTTYSTPEDMARSAAWLINRGLPQSSTSYPRFFSVLSNAQVARSLGIPLPDDATLARRLAELEQEP